MKTFLLCLFFCFLQITAAFQITSFENGSETISIPNIQIQNNEDTLKNFTLYYYFSAANTKDISLESYFLNGGIASIEQLSENQYRVKIDFDEITIKPSEKFPNNGYLQFGLHYNDWSIWEELDDYSNSNYDSVGLNNRIVIVSSGNILAGNFPTDENLNLAPTFVKIYTKSQNEDNYGKYNFYVKNEGNVPVTNLKFDIEFTSENLKEPVIDKFHLGNANYALTKKDSNIWVLHFNIENINLEPNSIYPNESGYSFGIHYNDWSSFDISNDYALKSVTNNYQANEKIPVYINDKLIFGFPKIHNLTDFEKFLAAENGYTQEEFNTPLSSLIDTTINIQMTWEELESLSNIIFKDIPNFDTTSVAFFQILEKVQGLDTLFLTQNFKPIRQTYEHLLQLRLAEHFNKFKMRKTRSMVSGAYDKYKSLNKYEVKLLATNPLKIPGTIRAYHRAMSWASEYAYAKIKNGNSYNTRADAFRHSVWNALLCRETGTQYDDIAECLDWAKSFTNAHEKTSENGIDKSMDLHNNKIGRDYYAPKLKVGCEWDLGFACINEEVVGPSREATKEMYKDLANKGIPFNDENQLEKTPWIRALVFFRNDNGKIYCSTTHTTNCAPFEMPELQASKIAVLKKDLNFTCEEEFSFRLDLEDSDNGSKIISGDPNPPGIELGKGGITFTYCVLNVDNFNGQLPRVPYDYIVLRMDRDCPTGSYAFSRHHDTEDSNNGNYSTGELGPNVVTKNATLEYCFVPADETSTLEYPFAKEYGVFANYSSTNIIHSEIFTDDEDSDNANSWNWYDTPSDIKERIRIIMNGSSNTIYYAIQWIEIVFSKILNWLGV